MPDTPDMQWTARADWVDAGDGTVAAMRPGYVTTLVLPNSSAAWRGRRNLIAAAPSMLAALREAEDRIAALEEDGMTKAERAALSRIRAAIAKATAL